MQIKTYLSTGTNDKRKPQKIFLSNYSPRPGLAYIDFQLSSVETPYDENLTLRHDSLHKNLWEQKSIHSKNSQFLLKTCFFFTKNEL